VRRKVNHFEYFSNGHRQAFYSKPTDYPRPLASPATLRRKHRTGASSSLGGASSRKPTRPASRFSGSNDQPAKSAGIERHTHVEKLA